MHAQHRPTRPTRVLPHLKRRNGLVEAPRDHTARSSYAAALAVGWRPQI